MEKQTRELDPFVFIDGGRTFTCSVDIVRRASSERWWWFIVSAESHQRFAPFRVGDDDTQDDVRDRVVAYYDQLLVRRAEPSRGYWPRGGTRPGVAGVSPAAAPIAVPGAA